MKELENGKINAFNKKFKYYKNKKYISHTILIIGELRLKYNKPQLTATIKLEINN